MAVRRRFDPGWLIPRLALLLATLMIATMALWLLAIRFAND
jgi:hypothetical protein